MMQRFLPRRRQQIQAIGALRNRCVPSAAAAVVGMSSAFSVVPTRTLRTSTFVSTMGEAAPEHACALRRRSVYTTYSYHPAAFLSTAHRYLSSSSTSPSTSTNVPRTNISLVGAVNAGKSVLMNVLTQSNTSIVHDTAGTTTDPKLSVMELHGRIGPVRLMDTPGINEVGELGMLKRQRTLQTINQCDVAVIVVDPFAPDIAATITSVVDLLQHVQQRQRFNEQVDVAPTTVDPNPVTTATPTAAAAMTTAPAAAATGGRKISTTLRPIPLLLFNLRQDKVQEFEAAAVSKYPNNKDSKDNDTTSNSVTSSASASASSSTAPASAVSLWLEEVEKRIVVAWAKRLGVKDVTQLHLPPTLAVDLAATGGAASRDRVIQFLERYTDPRPESVALLPASLQYDIHTQAGHIPPTVLLNIPMDPQTPSMRLLRPQAMVQEALIRNYISTLCYRMDLQMARSNNPQHVQIEKDRFLRVLEPYLNHNNSGHMALLMTDSQAMDIVAPWTLDENGTSLVPITTFSITMIRYLSGGRLDYFIDGLRQLDAMITRQVEPVQGRGQKWKVLITEACQHTRLNMEKQCADIGTVQLPRHLRTMLGGEDQVEFDYAFGKHVLFLPSTVTTSNTDSTTNTSDTKPYDLVVHCGGCMLTQQQMEARVADLMAAGIPATNYGLLLSRIQSPATLSRVLEPWGIQYTTTTNTTAATTTSTST